MRSNACNREDFSLQRFSVNPQVRFLTDEYGGILLDLTRGVMFHLNEVAGVIWQCLTAGVSGQEIVAAVSVECGLEPQELIGDIHTFLRELVKREIIRLE